MSAIPLLMWQCICAFMHFGCLCFGCCLLLFFGRLYSVFPNHCDLHRAIFSVLGENIALHKPAYQSSDNYNTAGTANVAVDGNRDSNFKRGWTCTHTTREHTPWFVVDLQREYLVTKVAITNRGSSSTCEYLLIRMCCVHQQFHHNVFSSCLNFLQMWGWETLL